MKSCGSLSEKFVLQGEIVTKELRAKIRRGKNEAKIGAINLASQHLAKGDGIKKAWEIARGGKRFIIGWFRTDRHSN